LRELLATRNFRKNRLYVIAGYTVHWAAQYSNFAIKKKKTDGAWDF